MTTFVVATAASIAINLAINALTQGDDKTQDENVIFKSGYGFPLEKPFGTVRLRSRNLFWGLPIDVEETETQGDNVKGGAKKVFGGFVGGIVGGIFGGAVDAVTGETPTAEFYATFAVMGGWGEIKGITKVALNNELVYDLGAPTTILRRDGEILNMAYSASLTRYLQNNELYLGTSNQNPSPIIEAHEGVGNVPAFNNRFYLVFKRFKTSSGSYPTVDIEVEAYEKTLPEVLTWVCKAKGLTDAQIEIDPALDKHQNVNITFNQDGTSVGSFIQELQKIYFFFTIDAGDKIIFRDFDTPLDLEIVALTEDNLAAVAGNSDAIDRYKHLIPDVLDLPSEFQLEYVSKERNYDLGLQQAFRYEAQYQNDVNIRTRQVLTDTEASNIAWKSLGIIWSQSRRLENILLLPSVAAKLKLGNIFTVPIDGADRFFQLETKEIGDNNLAEINAVSYETTDTNFVVNNPSFPNTPNIIPTGSAIALDIPIFRDEHSDLGIYVGVVSPQNWQYGGIYISVDDDGDYTPLTNFTGLSTVGTVNQVPEANNPNIIDRGSEIIVEVANNGRLENISETEFLRLEQLGLFGNEIIAWQNAELIAAATYKLTKLIRGLRGTEHQIDNHTVGERFVLLAGSGARILRVPANLDSLRQTIKLKAVHGGQSPDFVEEETSIYISGQGIAPYSPVTPEILLNTETNDLTIEWTLRTRRLGQWRDYGDIVHSDSNQSTLEILDSNGSIVHTIEIFNYDNPSYLFDAQQQIDKLGSLQTELSFNVYQVSQFYGRGYPLEVRNMQPTKFI